jgi:hypothetical protein
MMDSTGFQLRQTGRKPGVPDGNRRLEGIHPAADVIRYVLLVTASSSWHTLGGIAKKVHRHRTRKPNYASLPPPPGRIGSCTSPLRAELKTKTLGEATRPTRPIPHARTELPVHPRARPPRAEHRRSGPSDRIGIRPWISAGYKILTPRLGLIRASIRGEGTCHVT